MSINGNANTPIVGENNSSVSTSVPENNANKINRGYIYELKQKVSTKMADLVNRLVTRQIEKRLLRCLPANVQQEVMQSIEGIIQGMVVNISSQSLDTGENILKALPAYGNVLSVLSALDNVLAGIKNTKNSVFQIKEQIDKIQGQVNNINNVAGQSGGDGTAIISNNLQTIINRAHHSVAQHHADVHHLIEHRNKIHNYVNKKTIKNNRSQKGGQTKPKTNNSQTILERASHSVAQHHGDLTHNVILKRTSKSIRDFHNTTKRLRRG